MTRQSTSGVDYNGLCKGVDWRRENVVKALDSAIQTLSALRDNQKVLRTLSLVPDLENPSLDLDSLHSNVNTSEQAFRTAKASCREILLGLDKSSREMDGAQSYVDKAVKIFRDARGSLDDFRRAVDEQLGRLNRSHGLARLPDDVLSLIFEATCSDNFTWQRGSLPFRIASVCRRFREVALSTPRIWCWVSSDKMNIEVLKICLHRSQNTKLHVEASSSPYQRTDEDFEWYNTFLKVVNVYNDRWGSLVIRGDSKAFDAFKQHLSSAGPSAVLTRLRAVNLEDLTEPESFFRFLEQYAPNLLSVTMDMAFNPNINVKLPHGITRLCIEPDCLGPRTNINIRRFVAMLRSTRIEELQLRFYSFDEEFLYGREVRDGKYRAKQFDVTEVKSLEIQVLARQLAMPLFESLHFSAIENLVLEITEPSEGAVLPKYEDEEEEDGLALGLELLETWFIGRSFPKLRSIALRMELEAPKPGEDYIYFPTHQIMDISRSSPKLDNLELSCSHLTDSLLLPPLRSLTLNHVQMKNSWLQDYGESLKEGGKLDLLKRLVLNRCKMDGVALDGEEWGRELPEFADQLVVITDK